MRLKCLTCPSSSGCTLIVSSEIALRAKLAFFTPQGATICCLDLTFRRNASARKNNNRLKYSVVIIMRKASAHIYWEANAFLRTQVCENLILQFGPSGRFTIAQHGLNTHNSNFAKLWNSARPTDQPHFPPYENAMMLASSA